MKKTILTIVIFVLFAAAVALAVSYFLNPQKIVTQRFKECVLMQEKTKGTIGCFGCANNICKDAPQNWTIYTNSGVGIPYACTATDKGCELAQ